MEEEEASRRDLSALKKHYEETLPLLREHLLTGLLEGRLDKLRAKELSKRYGMGLSGKCAVVACIKHERRAIEEDDTLAQLSVKRLVDDALNGRVQSHTIVYADYVVCCVVLAGDYIINNIITLMGEVCSMSERYLDRPLSIGVGYVREAPGGVNASYRGALAALDYQLTAGVGRVVFIGDIEPDEIVDVSVTAQDEQFLLSAIRSGADATISDAVTTLLSRCPESRIPYQKYQVYLLEIFTALIRIVRLNKIDIEGVFGRDFDIVRELSQLDSIAGVRDKLCALCLKASSFMRRERQNTSVMLVERAKAYAADNYRDENFSVDGMCRELHVSPAYFSTVFKKSGGVSFVNFLTHMRLDEAVRLLEGTDEKTHQIAAQVGFSDPNYFSFVFKKEFGVPPTKWRKKDAANV